MSEKNYTTSKSHSFSVEVAEEFGVECAILINHFQFWIQQNMDTGKNFHDGRTWMYQTQEDIAAIYPYWNRDKVQDLIHKLVEYGILIKGNYNKKKFDRTQWYAFKNQEMFTKVRNRTMDSAKPHIAKCETAQPIPDNLPNANKITTTETPQDKPSAVVVFSEKLDKLDIPLKDKNCLVSKYDIETIDKAIDFALSPRTKIKTTLVQTIKWACENKPEIPLSEEEEISLNREYAESFRFSNKNYIVVEILSKFVEIVFLDCQKPSIVIEYTKKNFRHIFNDYLKKYELI